MTVVSAVSGLNVALPDLARETGATQTQITWIVDAYTVVFAGLLLFAGALGDRFGRRLLLVAGLGVFGLAAALGMVTSDPQQLIALRALMGVGAAAIMPTTLSVITTSFPVEERPEGDRRLGRRRRRRRGARPVRQRAAAASSSRGARSSGSTSSWRRLRWSAPSPSSRPRSTRTRPRLDVVGAAAVTGRRRRRPCSRSSRVPTAAGATRSPSPALVVGRQRWRRVRALGAATSRSRCSTRGCSGCAASAPAR